MNIRINLVKDVNLHKVLIDNIKERIISTGTVELGFEFYQIWGKAWSINEEKKNFPLLSSVDPYDDTIFNSSQCEILLLELENLSKLEDLQSIDYIINTIKSIERGQYLLMIGD